MSYIDAIIDKDKDRIHVVERDANGERKFNDYPVDYIFYYDDKKGKHQTIYRTPVSKFLTHSGNEFRKEMRMHSGTTLWESDCNTIFRCLETNYLGTEAPKLHTCFFDIETDWGHGPADDNLVVLLRNHSKKSMTVKELRALKNHDGFEVFDPRLKAWLTVDNSTLLDKSGGVGYAPTSDPFNKITAITVYLDWLDKLITLAIPPRTLTWDEASAIADRFTDTHIFAHESELLDTFLSLIDDADVLSGWNSEGYDIPYTVGRIIRSLSKDDTRRMCLWNQLPKKREFERYGSTSITFDLVGRVHVDYMQLYRKYTYEERHSYSLDAIGEYELNERKVAYEGSLDQLYNQDFYKFLDYNRQDTKLLANLDKKLQFLDLTNNIAHENTVLIQTTMGAVAVTDQAIINEAHRLGYVVPSRKPNEKAIQAKRKLSGEDDDDDDDHSESAAGAYVAYPKIGMHKYIGAIDINSLYPSTIRACNMGPETIVGQLRPIMTDAYIKNKMADSYVGKKKVKGTSFAGAWEGLFGSLEYSSVIDRDSSVEITIDWEGGEPTVHSAEEVHDLIFNGGEKWILSANGTIFRHDIEGIIPGLLSRWYAERKVLQKKKKEVGDLQYGIELPTELSASITPLLASAAVVQGPIDVPKIKEAIQQNNHAELAAIINQFGLVLTDNKITATLDQIKYATGYWDKKQQVKKIGLNSLYGALLNPGCRFHDHRIGQSTTLTGRTIAKHMDSFVNHQITGEYKYDGDAVVYGDTDSVYFSVWPMIKNEVESGKMQWSKDDCIKLYDDIADQVNASFPEMMKNACNCPTERGSLIKGGRELIATSGLFVKKKRYAVLVFDMEGVRLDLMDEATAAKKGVKFGVGKVKAMGLDLKRSDTPKIVQDFLSNILMSTLTDAHKDSVIAEIVAFKEYFTQLPPWEKGTPKRVNNLTSYRESQEKDSKTAMPGHVRAALNWNLLRRMHGDNHSPMITDGMKTIVCKLKNNPMGYTSIAYPIDVAHIPEWFKELPFDEELMESTIVDQKVENLLGVLKWDITQNTCTKTTFNSLFDFS